MADKRQKWIDTLAAFLGGRKVICPECGGHEFKNAYVRLNDNDDFGYGAFWCENCRKALVLCRANLADDKIIEKIVPALPADLKFI